MALHPMSRDVFVRHTDPAGKRPAFITQHLVWDIDRFMAAQVKLYDTDAKPQDRQVITRATAAEYRAAQKKGR